MGKGHMQEGQHSVCLPHTEPAFSQTCKCKVFLRKLAFGDIDVPSLSFFQVVEESKIGWALPRAEISLSRMEVDPCIRSLIMSLRGQNYHPSSLEQPGVICEVTPRVPAQWHLVQMLANFRPFGGHRVLYWKLTFVNNGWRHSDDNIGSQKYWK